MVPQKVTFWTLLEKSVIVQSFITAVIILVDLYLFIKWGSLPEGLDRLTYIVVSFWMGSKVQHTIDATTRARG